MSEWFVYIVLDAVKGYNQSIHPIATNQTNYQSFPANQATGYSLRASQPENYTIISRLGFELIA